MKKILFNIYLVFIISLFLQCKENIEKDSYEIINLILMEKVNAYGSKISLPNQSLLEVKTMKNLTTV